MKWSLWKENLRKSMSILRWKWNEGVVESAAMREHFFCTVILHASSSRLARMAHVFHGMIDYRPMLDDDEHDVINIIKFY